MSVTDIGRAQVSPASAGCERADLYIPLMGAGTYSLLICLAAAQRRKFKPELMTTAVSTTFAAWCAHTILLKVRLQLLHSTVCCVKAPCGREAGWVCATRLQSVEEHGSHFLGACLP
jgi:YIF1